jgi:hypothetical protein
LLLPTHPWLLHLLIPQCIWNKTWKVEWPLLGVALLNKDCVSEIRPKKWRDSVKHSWQKSLFKRQKYCLPQITYLYWYYCMSLKKILWGHISCHCVCLSLLINKWMMIPNDNLSFIRVIEIHTCTYLSFNIFHSCPANIVLAVQVVAIFDFWLTLIKKNCKDHKTKGNYTKFLLYSMVVLEKLLITYFL